MGYLHIENLYKNKNILMLRECYALEKLDGCSAEVAWEWQKKKMTLGSGALSETRMLAILPTDLTEKLKYEFPDQDVIVYGELVGAAGELPKGYKYGDKLQFIVFDVKVDGYWLNVPNAHNVATKLGLPFVEYEIISATIEAITERLAKPSSYTIDPKYKKEGDILRPLIELRTNADDGRLIIKNKNPESKETATDRPVNAEKLKVLEDAIEIANEWVTEERLEHVLQKIQDGRAMKNRGLVMKAMIEDVYREGKGEIIESREVQAAITKRTAFLLNAEYTK